VTTSAAVLGVCAAAEAATRVRRGRTNSDCLSLVITVILEPPVLYEATSIYYQRQYFERFPHRLRDIIGR
jgi:hypothetical protein